MKKYLIFSIILLAVIFAFFFLPKNLFSGNEVIFNVQKGQGAKEISANLQEAGLINFSPGFWLYVFLTGRQDKLKAGYYSLSSSMQISEIAAKISAGDVIKVGITVFEGSNLSQAHLYTNVPLENENLEDYRKDYDFLSDAPQGATLEGYLFPDTYYFSYGDTSKEVAQIMLANFGKKLTQDMRAEIKRQGKTIFEIVTMASLIEKEVRGKDDKEIVSGILWKRLGIGMPLQVDATIIYAKGDGSQNISAEDKKIDSPYNTYKYSGLPAGPICSPGLESINAAVYPKSSQYWYYLSAPDGRTIFSRNLDEHNAARAKYLK